MADDTDDKNVEIWKVKKLIKSLEAARGYEPPMNPPFFFQENHRVNTVLNST